VARATPGRLVLGTGETHEVVLVDLRAGRVTAAVATTDAFDPSSVPAVAGDLAVVVDRAGTVTALDAATGTRRWQARLDRPTLDTRPAVTAGSVAVTDWARTLVVLDRVSGRIRRSPAAGAGGLAVAVGAGASRLVVALRLASPDRVEAWSVP
jgi:outer membrane protein assembly factor BamB